jgi:predicted metal-dependent phosphoesterase TrpH
MKIDIHCHSYYSDGLSSPRQIAREIARKKLDGFSLTDHETTKGWQEAKETAKELGLLFVEGEEIKTKQGDILALFIKEEIKGKGKDVLEVIKEIKKQEGIVVIPHPFHFYLRFKDDVKKYLSFIDALEVLNGRSFLKKPDLKALKLAQEKNISQAGGSDCHYFKEAGSAYTLIEDVQNLGEFKKGILEKRSKAQGEKAPLRYLVFRSFCWFRFNKIYKNFSSVYEKKIKK